MKNGTATARLTGTTAILYVHYDDGSRRMHTLEDVNEWRHVKPWLEDKLSEHEMLDDAWKNGRGETIVRSVAVNDEQQSARDAASEQVLRARQQARQASTALAQHSEQQHEQENELDRSQRRNCSVESAFDLDYCRR